MRFDMLFYKFTQQQVADALYVDRVTISQWENGSRDIKTGNMVSLAEYFDVSCDFLLGRTRATAADDFMQEAVKRFGLNEKVLEMFLDKPNIIKYADMPQISSAMMLRSLFNEMLTSQKGIEALKTLAKYCFTKIELSRDASVDYIISDMIDDTGTFTEMRSIDTEDLREVILTHFCTQMREFREKLKGDSDGEHN
jgi:transcriptional regulator with XRE-family HTH domain